VDRLNPVRLPGSVPTIAQLPLSERLRPTRLDDVVGNPRAHAELKAWAERWAAGRPPAHRAAVLSGPPGVGKTSAALALASDFGWSVVEMNASDARNERAIDQIAGRASITHTLMDASRGPGRRRALILLDEADSLSGRSTEGAKAAPTPAMLRDFLRGRYGAIESLNQAWGLTPTAKPTSFESWDQLPRSPGNYAWARLPPARKDIDDWKGAARPRDISDRGGLAAMARLVRSTRQPMILTVNDDRTLTRYSPVFRTAVTRVRFYAIADRELLLHLGAIARREEIGLAPGALEAIVRRARGDLRAALNDLDAVAPVPPGPLQLEVLGTRDVAADFEAIAAEVLSSARYYRSVEIRDRLDAPPDDLLPWIEENIPHFAPDAAHRSAAFDRLAAAERLLAFARRHRIWGLWSYASELLTGGTGLAIRDRPVPVTGRALFPRFLGEMGRSRSMRALRESIVVSAGSRFHVSKLKSRETFLPFLETLFDALHEDPNNSGTRAVARRVVRELDLTAEQVGYLVRAEPGSATVIDLTGASGEPPEASPADEPDVPPMTDETAVAKDEADASGSPRRPVQRSLSDFGAR
jgi:DNA polymerase III delta prime subunit